MDPVCLLLLKRSKDTQGKLDYNILLLSSFMHYEVYHLKTIITAVLKSHLNSLTFPVQKSFLCVCSENPCSDN